MIEWTRIPEWRRASLVLTLVCLAILVHRPVLAQSVQLSGLVRDEQAASVQGAEITLVNELTGLRRVTRSDERGGYVLAGVAPGRYRLEVVKQGFKRHTRAGVQLEGDNSAQLDVSLQVDDRSESVDVVATTPILNTRDGSVGITVDRHFAENVPMNGRTFHSLIELAPGVTTYNGRFVANGQRPDSNYFTVDGVSANVTGPSRAGMQDSASGQYPGGTITGGFNGLTTLDGLQEVRIQTSTFAPEFGRSPGAQVSVVTRSGTNTIRGSFFESFRDDALNANDWFTNNKHLPEQPLRQHGVGGSLGGPLVRNTLFYFGTYEGLWLKESRPVVTSVPSLEARRLAPASVRPLFDAHPLPTGPDSGMLAEYAVARPIKTNQQVVSGRVDAQLRPDTQVFGRYSDTPSSNESGLIGSVQDISRRFNTITVGVNHVRGAHAVAELRANYSRSTYVENFVDTANLGSWFPSFLDYSHADRILVGALGGNVIYFGSGPVYDNAQRQLNVVGSLSLLKAGHHYKVGIDYRRLMPELDVRNEYDVYFRSMQDALAGLASELYVWGFNDPGTVNYSNVSLFAQDTWRPLERLTLTYGLRWDVNPPPGFEEGREPFPAANVSDPAAFAFGQRGKPLWKTRYTNVAPRLGISYSLDEAARTLLSAGVGLFYDTGTQNSGFYMAGGYYPILTQRSMFKVQLPFTEQDLSLAAQRFTPPFPDNIVLADPELRSPVTTQWNVKLERQLGMHQTVSLAYVGARGSDLLTRSFYSKPNSIFTGTVSLLNAEGNSRYRSLQAHYRRRMSAGVQVSASYTYGRALDNVSDSMATYLPTQLQQASEWGPADYDVRHSFTSAVSWMVPVSASSCRLCGVASGWSMDLMARARSATPVNVTTGLDPLGTGIRWQRPDLVPGVPVYVDDPSAPRGRRLNRAAFTAPGSGAQGNLGRNTIAGFDAKQFDLAVRRSFKLPSNVNVSFRVDVYNLFNTPNFRNPQSVMSSSRFGLAGDPLNLNPMTSLGEKLSSVYLWGGARAVELGLRASF